VKKILKSVITLTICFVMLLRNDILVNAEEEPTEVLQDLRNIWYETRYFPFYYGNDEFVEKYRSHDYTDEERRLRTNPPEEMLLTMSSEELAELLLEYPEICRMMQVLTPFPDFGWLFGMLEIECDIFYELLRREDGITSILQAYKDNEYIEESYNQGSDIGRLWYGEMLGCHFIIYYSPLFSESEYIMAREILEEKSKRYYAELKDYQLEYMSLEDLTIEPPSGEPVKKIRTKYLDEDEIQEKEDRLEAARIKLDEIKKQEERERQKERAKEIRKFLVRCLIIGGTGIGVAGVVAGSVFIIRKRRRKDAD